MVEHVAAVMDPPPMRAGALQQGCLDGAHDDIGHQDACIERHRVERQRVAGAKPERRGIDGDVDALGRRRHFRHRDVGIMPQQAVDRDLRARGIDFGDEQSSDAGLAERGGNGAAGAAQTDQPDASAAHAMALGLEPAHETRAVDNVAGQDAVRLAAHQIDAARGFGAPGGPPQQG